MHHGYLQKAIFALETGIRADCLVRGKNKFRVFGNDNTKSCSCFSGTRGNAVVDTHTTYFINIYHWNITLKLGRFLPLFTFTRIMAENGISQLLHPPHLTVYHGMRNESSGICQSIATTEANYLVFICCTRPTATLVFVIA